MVSPSWMVHIWCVRVLSMRLGPCHEELFALQTSTIDLERIMMSPLEASTSILYSGTRKFLDNTLRDA